MNNHLHMLEAYAHLFRVWPDPLLADRLRELVSLFHQKILNAENSHLHHFFTETWMPRSDNYTFGHDIEGSWLLCEAADALGDPVLRSDTRDLAVRIARTTQSEGLDADGGLHYEGQGGRITDDRKEWWPQAEAVIGFFNAWQISHDRSFLESAIGCWQFIQKYVVDPKDGEWFWRVSRQGVPDLDQPKVSAWKCPYHNSRCCLELIQRTRPPSPSENNL
jgi:mannobiose 2-epimerase